MSDPCEDICDALVLALNTAQEVEEGDDPFFVFAFEASKPEDPNGELDKLFDTVRVLVWPHGESEVKTGRGGQVREVFEVAMLVTRMLDAEFTRTNLARLVRELKAFLRGQRMAAMEDGRGYVYSGAETTLVDLARLHENQQLINVTILSYIGTA